MPIMLAMKPLVLVAMLAPLWQTSLGGRLDTHSVVKEDCPEVVINSKGDCVDIATGEKTNDAMDCCAPIVACLDDSKDLLVKASERMQQFYQAACKVPMEVFGGAKAEDFGSGLCAPECQESPLRSLSIVYNEGECDYADSTLKANRGRLKMIASMFDPIDAAVEECALQAAKKEAEEEEALAADEPDEEDDDGEGGGDDDDGVDEDDRFDDEEEQEDEADLGKVLSVDEEDLFTPIYKNAGASVFVVDTSGSMGTTFQVDGKTVTRLDHVKSQLEKTFIDMPEHQRFGLAKFGDKVRMFDKSLVLATKENKAAALAWLGKEKTWGSTLLRKALMEVEFAYGVGDGFASGSIYLVSDGIPTDCRGGEDCLLTCRSKGVCEKLCGKEACTPPTIHTTFFQPGGTLFQSRGSADRTKKARALLEVIAKTTGGTFKAIA